MLLPPPIDNIRAMIAYLSGGKGEIIRLSMCCIVYWSCARRARSWAHL